MARQPSSPSFICRLLLPLACLLPVSGCDIASIMAEGKGISGGGERNARQARIDRSEDEYGHSRGEMAGVGAGGYGNRFLRDSYDDIYDDMDNENDPAESSWDRSSEPDGRKRFWSSGVAPQRGRAEGDMNRHDSRADERYANPEEYAQRSGWREEETFSNDGQDRDEIAAADTAQTAGAGEPEGIPLLKITVPPRDTSWRKVDAATNTIEVASAKPEPPGLRKNAEAVYKMVGAPHVTEVSGIEEKRGAGNGGKKQAEKTNPPPAKKSAQPKKTVAKPESKHVANADDKVEAKPEPSLAAGPFCEQSGNNGLLIGMMAVSPTEFDKPVQEIPMTIKQVVESVLRENRSIQVAAFRPDQAKADVMSAKSVYDPEVFGSWTHGRTEAEPAMIIGGTNPPNREFRNETGRAGIRQHTPTGAKISAYREWNSGVERNPGSNQDRGHGGAYVAEITQPILNGFGDAENRALIEISQLQLDSSVEEFKQTVIETMESPLVRADLQKSIDAALANRPEMNNVDLAIRTSEVRRRYAKHSLLPELNLIGSLRRNDKDGYAPTSSSSTTYVGTDWSVGVEFSMPIGNMKARSNVRKAEAEMSQMAAEKKNVRDIIITEVRTIVKNLDLVIREIPLNKRAMEAAEKVLEGEWAKLELNQTGNNDLLQAQDLVAVTKRNYISSLIRYNIYIVRLYAAQGVLLEKMGINLR